jgi:glycerol-3-phosphate dehydrogenase (NAD(P)+)
VEIVVVGGGSWGTAFSCLPRERHHDVTLACRDPVQVLAIREFGRNPRYLTGVDLSSIDATTIEDAPVEDADLVVLAVPSRAFAGVAAALPGDSPVLSLTKGSILRRGTVCRRVWRDVPLRSCPGRTWRRRSPRVSRRRR